MERGWIKLWRKIQDSLIFQNEGLLKVFVWCLLKCTHREIWAPIKTGQGCIEVKTPPGSFIFGRHQAAKELKMSPSTVRNRILKLKKLGFLDTQSNTHYSIIHIINWDTYQHDSKKEDIQKDSQRTTKGHIQELKEHGEYKCSPTQKETSRILPHEVGLLTCPMCGQQTPKKQIDNWGSCENCFKPVSPGRVKELIKSIGLYK
jgi:biotin operon repressor